MARGGFQIPGPPQKILFLKYIFLRKLSNFWQFERAQKLWIFVLRQKPCFMDWAMVEKRPTEMIKGYKLDQENWREKPKAI